MWRGAPRYGPPGQRPAVRPRPAAQVGVVLPRGGYGMPPPTVYGVRYRPPAMVYGMPMGPPPPVMPLPPPPPPSPPPPRPDPPLVHAMPVLDAALAEAPAALVEGPPNHPVQLDREAVAFGRVAAERDALAAGASPGHRLVLACTAPADANVHLVGVCCRPPVPEFAVQALTPAMLSMEHPVDVHIEFTPTPGAAAGRFATWLVLEFERPMVGTVHMWAAEKFRLVRRVTALTYHPDEEAALNPEAPIFWNRAWHEAQEKQAEAIVTVDTDTLSDDLKRIGHLLAEHKRQV